MERLRSLAAMLLQPGCCHFSRYSKKKINVQPLHATEHSGGGMKPTQTLHPTGRQTDLKSCVNITTVLNACLTLVSVGRRVRLSGLICMLPVIEEI